MLFPTLLIIVIFNCFHQLHASRLLLPISNGDCTFQYVNQTLHEGDKIVIEKRIYKVEHCQLQRAYQTCGKHLWFMINIACDAIHVKINRSRRFTSKQLLTEACCDQACTVNEMTRYCPN